MARTYIGAFFEFIKRELASKFHRDLVLELETGPATSQELRKLTEDLRREFPTLTKFAAGGDAKHYWRMSVTVRPRGEAENLRNALIRWASENEPFVRRYTVRQRSLWRPA